jgi:threonine dehydrogenase-like Zn-dependent dehydrogenase
VAHFALDRAGLAAGESVLVRGGSGSIGVMAIQLAAARGAGTIAVTTSAPDRGHRFRSLGATDVLDRDGGLVCFILTGSGGHAKRAAIQAAEATAKKTAATAAIECAHAGDSWPQADRNAPQQTIFAIE